MRYLTTTNPIGRGAALPTPPSRGRVSPHPIPQPGGEQRQCGPLQWRRRRGCWAGGKTTRRGRHECPPGPCPALQGAAEPHQRAAHAPRNQPAGAALDGDRGRCGRRGGGLAVAGRDLLLNNHLDKFKHLMVWTRC